MTSIDDSHLFSSIYNNGTESKLKNEGEAIRNGKIRSHSSIHTGHICAMHKKSCMAPGLLEMIIEREKSIFCVFSEARALFSAEKAIFSRCAVLLSIHLAFVVHAVNNNK